MGRNGREKDEGKEERVHTGVKVFLAGIRARFDSKELFFFNTRVFRVSACVRNSCHVSLEPGGVKEKRAKQQYIRRGIQSHFTHTHSCATFSGFKDVLKFFYY